MEAETLGAGGAGPKRPKEEENSADRGTLPIFEANPVLWPDNGSFVESTKKLPG